MANIHRRRESILLSTARKFFKIIFDPLADRLRIPAGFIKRYGENLPNRVFLKVPSGSVLEVGLVQSNGETLLQKGWQEFRERYSIGFGYFLVFEYNGNSQFNVLIFDTSASEINYPFDFDFDVDQSPLVEDDSVVLLEEFLTSDRGKGESKNVEDSGKSESDVSIQILDNPLARQQNRRKRRHCDDTGGFQDNYPLKESVRGKQNLSSCVERISRSKLTSPTHHSEYAVHGRVKLEDSTSEECSDHTRRQCSDTIQKQRTIVKETCIGYQKAVAFTSGRTSHKPFFICLMQPSYVSAKFSLNVPLAFVRANLPRGTTNLTLQLTNGKTWSVRCTNGRRTLSSG